MSQTTLAPNEGDQFDEPPEIPSRLNLGTHLIVSVVVSTVTAVFIWGEITGQSLVPIAIRQLAIGATVGAWATWYVARFESRSNHRWDVIERKMEMRRRQACCAESYVEGLSRRPFGAGGERDL